MRGGGPMEETQREELYQIAEEAVRDADLKSTDIPAIDLYVDQIINLVSEKLNEGSARFHDRLLTKTMINNYSKDGLITPVKGKKYSKEQVIQMLTVYTLKSTLSIGEIKRLLDGAYGIEGFDGAALTKLYDRHLEIKEENRALADKLLFDLIDEHALSLTDDNDYIIAVCAVISLSAHLKNIAQAMIDARFPEPEEPEEAEEAEKDKEKVKGRRRRKKRLAGELEITEYVESENEES